MINKSSFFQSTPSGNFIAYHCEGGETFKMSGAIALSMETLHNDRPLFLGNNIHEWVPRHLNDLYNYRLYKIIFRPPEKIKTYKFFNDYLKLNSESKELQQLIKNGYHLFILDQNDKNELTESFLFFSTEYVQSIDEIKI